MAVSRRSNGVADQASLSWNHFEMPHFICNLYIVSGLYKILGRQEINVNHTVTQNGLVPKLVNKSYFSMLNSIYDVNFEKKLFWLLTKLNHYCFHYFLYSYIQMCFYGLSTNLTLQFFSNFNYVITYFNTQRNVNKNNF